MQGYFGGYTLVALLGLVGIGFIATGFAANRLLRPWRHTEAKLLTYESGVDPVGEDWAQSQVRYYVYAFLYVVFAVDAVFLFPWAVMFDRLALFGFIEMSVFLVILITGYVFIWNRGALRWA